MKNYLILFCIFTFLIPRPLGAESNELATTPGNQQCVVKIQSLLSQLDVPTLSKSALSTIEGFVLANPAINFGVEFSHLNVSNSSYLASAYEQVEHVGKIRGADQRTTNFPPSTEQRGSISGDRRHDQMVIKLDGHQKSTNEDISFASTDALGSAYKRTFFRKLDGLAKERPDLFKNASFYSDSNSIRGDLGRDNLELRDKIAKFKNETDQEYEKLIYKNDELRRKWKRSARLPNPSKTYNLSFGKNADQTAVGARMGVKNWDELVKEGTQLIDKIEGNIRSIYRIDPKLSNLFQTGTNGKPEISLEAWKILRKSKDPKEVRNQLHYVKIHVTHQEARELVAYYQNLDKFSPELLLKKPTQLDFSQIGGSRAADVEGMGATNMAWLERAFRNHLATTKVTDKKVLLKQLIQVSRYSEVHGATPELNKKIGFIEKVLSEMDRMGDDLNNPLNKIIPLKDRTDDLSTAVGKLAGAKLAEKKSFAGFRISDVGGTQTVVNAKGKRVFTKEPIGENLVKGHNEDMQLVLKNLNTLCKQWGLFEECEKLVFAGQVIPTTGSNAIYRIFVGGAINSKRLTKATIQKLARKAMKISKPDFKVKGEKVLDPELITVRGNSTAIKKYLKLLKK